MLSIPLPTEAKYIQQVNGLYAEYVRECYMDGLKPQNFNNWYQVAFWYDYQDCKD